MSADRRPVIVAAKRTPIGKFFGSYSRTPATTLGSLAVGAALDAAPALRDCVDEVIMGCVLQAGLGQNPARQAALGAGLPTTMPCFTVNKVCGSGLKAIMLAAQAIRAGDHSVVIAGGMENMTRSPHYAAVRGGVKFGSAEMQDHMVHDGLTCPFEGWGMGNAAEWVADEFKISRAEQDRFSVQSHLRAAEATKNGWFKDELFPIEAASIKQKRDITADETFRADSNVDALAKLRPAFVKTGSVTPGNASQIADGAAAVAVCSAAKAEELGLAPMARITGYFTSGVDPKEIFTAPVKAVSEVLRRANLTCADVDLFELNEAFASQSLQNITQLEIPEDKVNICGGGVSLGHPIGASGARIVATLVHQMIRLDKNRGVASLCLGGGNAVAILVER